ncbi:alpha/beta hydrolase [Mycobacterium paraterrae]|nr:alpha/beta hydrolase [Mycobacterium paraterrae]
MWRTRQMSSALFSLTLTASVAVAAPAGSTPGYDAGPTPSPAAPQPASAPKLNWGSCSQIVKGTKGVPGAQCGTVTVPVDYANPAGAQVQLAVIKIPATGPRIGALLVNPGGPGASAVDMVASMGPDLAGSEVSRRFDLVGFDPRGVGHSTPGVHCQTDAEFDAYRRDPMVDYSPAGVAHIEQIYRDIAARCVARNGSAFLENVGTASAARDMDVVRQALGDDQINYLGYSYGTELGTAYLERYGEHVRAMVLDGAVDPSIGPIDELINQQAGFQTAFNDYAADCAHSADCPLGTDPNQWVARYHQLIDPLVTRPAPTPEGRPLGYSDAITGTINALYTPQFWKYLTSGLLGLRRGSDPGDLLTLADEYYGRDAKGHYNSSQDAFNAIRCVDAREPTDPATWADTDQRIRQVAPFSSYGPFTGHAPRDLCALWPVPATSSPHPAAPAGPGKVIVVSTTHDPATPYQAGVNLANQLGAGLISFEGTQHTVTFNGNECVDDAVVRYLVDGIAPGNLRC